MLQSMEYPLKKQEGSSATGVLMNIRKRSGQTGSPWPIRRRIRKRRSCSISCGGPASEDCGGSGRCRETGSGPCFRRNGQRSRNGLRSGESNTVPIPRIWNRNTAGISLETGSFPNCGRSMPVWENIYFPLRRKRKNCMIYRRLPRKSFIYAVPGVTGTERGDGSMIRRKPRDP